MSLPCGREFWFGGLADPADASRCLLTGNSAAADSVGMAMPTVEATSGSWRNAIASPGVFSLAVSARVNRPPIGASAWAANDFEPMTGLYGTSALIPSVTKTWASACSSAAILNDAWCGPQAISTRAPGIETGMIGDSVGVFSDDVLFAGRSARTIGQLRHLNGGFDPKVLSQCMGLTPTPGEWINMTAYVRGNLATNHVVVNFDDLLTQRVGSNVDTLRNEFDVLSGALEAWQQASVLGFYSVATEDLFAVKWSAEFIATQAARLASRLAIVVLALRVALRIRRAALFARSVVVSMATWMVTNGFHPPDSSLVAEPVT